MSHQYPTQRVKDTAAYKRIFEKSTRPEWLGDFGEAIWRNILNASGWNYISLASIAEGGAPLAHGPCRKTILPDYDAYKDGRSVFVESKAKSHSVLFRKKNEQRHGINYTNWRHYLRIQEETGKPCCIALVELECEVEAGRFVWYGSLLFETLNNLGHPLPNTAIEKPPKVYWPRKRFCDIDSFEPQELLDIANGKLLPKCNLELEQIICPHKQKELFT